MNHELKITFSCQKEEPQFSTVLQALECIAETRDWTSLKNCVLKVVELNLCADVFTHSGSAVADDIPLNFIDERYTCPSCY